MRIARFEAADGSVRLGVVVAGSGGVETLLDVGLAAAARPSAVPTTIMDLIASGESGLDQLRTLVDWANREQAPPWFTPLSDVRWLTPVPARFCLAAGRNFRDHLEESKRGSAERAKTLHTEFPTGFVKLPQALVPHRAEVRRPPDVVELDYEIELAAVLGKSVERVCEREAAAAIFGYTIMNDLSAREWQFREMDNRLLLVGKNFPGFGPLGPCILTADEVPDPSTFRLELSVNGELRQSGSCASMIFSVAELIAFWSRVGLAPGDVISTGTPEGVAVHRKPDKFAFYLKPGDVIEASVDRIGTLETRIVD